MEATGITKRFGSTVALHDAHITVEPGQTHALVGRNGAGKSTLVSVLTGLQAPDEGTVAFGGRARAPARRPRRLAAASRLRLPEVDDHPATDGRGEPVPEPARPTARPDQLARRCAAGRATCWRPGRWTWTPAPWPLTLTVEQRQFVEIARALSFGARFIILDEPTAQLDGAAISRLFDRIRDLQEQGVTFLFISHHLQEVYEICDTVTVFRDARHILTAPVAGLPRADLVAAMTGEAAPAGHAERPRGAARPEAEAERRPAPARTVSRCPWPIVRRRRLPGRLAHGAPGRDRGPGRGREQRPDRARRDRGRPALPRQPGRCAIAGRPPAARQRPGRPGRGRRIRPAGPAPPGLRPGDVGRPTTARSPSPQRLGRSDFINPGGATHSPHGLIDEPRHQDPGPGQHVSGLSGGNQQKVVMARALANDPRCWC